MMIYLEQELSILKESEKKLREENEIKQKRIEILEHNVEALTQALLKAAKQRFGASSERTPNSDEQLYLFEEKPEAQSEEEKAPKQAVKAHTRLKRKRGDKARLIADIPREVVECVLNPEEVCDECSSPLQVIGKKTVRTELEFIPAKLKVLEYVQLIFKCSNCGTTEDYPNAVFKKALHASVLNAVADYILKARPKSTSKEVFLRALSPYRPLNGANALDSVIKKIQ